MVARLNDRTSAAVIVSMKAESLDDDAMGQGVDSQGRTPTDQRVPVPGEVAVRIEGRAGLYKALATIPAKKRRPVRWARAIACSFAEQRSISPWERRG